MMTSFSTGRLIGLEEGEASWNMSVDQAILQSTSDADVGSAKPTLRFYSWKSPTLSLGYFQSAADALPRFETIHRVRRSTGGGAILHHHELTYSIALPVAANDSTTRGRLYREVHRAIRQTLRSFGIPSRRYADDRPRAVIENPFLCFQRRTDEDLVTRGYKVLGSAQRRAKRALLQHGSLLLSASEHAPELPGIAQLCSESLAAQEVASVLAERLGETLSLSFSAAQLTPEERGSAEEIRRTKFGSPDWLNRR